MPDKHRHASPASRIGKSGKNRYDISSQEAAELFEGWENTLANANARIAQTEVAVEKLESRVNTLMLVTAFVATPTLIALGMVA